MRSRLFIPNRTFNNYLYPVDPRRNRAGKESRNRSYLFKSAMGKEEQSHGLFSWKENIIIRKALKVELCFGKPVT